MRSEDRHELEKNSAEELVKNIREFFGKHGTIIILAVLVASIVLLAWANHVRIERQGIIEDVTLFERACNRMAEDPESAKEDFDTLIANDRSPRMVIQSMLELGGLYLEKAVRSISSTIREKSLKEAESNYNAALKKAGTEEKYKYLAAAAGLGIARVAENRGEFDKAAKEYGKVAENKSLNKFAAQRIEAESSLQRVKNMDEMVKLSATCPQWIIEKEKEEKKESDAVSDEKPSKKTDVEPKE